MFIIIIQAASRTPRVYVNVPEKYAVAPATRKGHNLQRRPHAHYTLDSPSIKCSGIPCGQYISNKRPSRFVILSKAFVILSKAFVILSKAFVILSKAKDLCPARDLYELLTS